MLPWRLCLLYGCWDGPENQAKLECHLELGNLELSNGLRHFEVQI